MKIVRLLASCFVYFCIGTVIAQSVGAAVLFGKGALNSGKVVDIMAVVYGLDLAAMRREIEEATRDEADVHAAYEEVVRKRVRSSLDIDLRESAIDRSLGELNNLQNNVVTEKERFNDLRTAFEARINELQNIANDARLRKVQQAVESMQPKLAKDQLLRWFDGGNKADVVAILGSMSPERQKKIIGEFKSEEDKAALNKILNEIRAGRAENELLDTANSQLQDITPN